MLRPPAGTYVKNTKAVFRTPADIYERPDSYHLLLDMPGLEVDKIKVKLEDGVLRVAGKKSKEEETSGVKALRIESRRAKYTRKFTLPEDANPEKVETTYKDGVVDSGHWEKACGGTEAEENLCSNLIDRRTRELFDFAETCVICDAEP